ncbi:uncharacterized protein PGTG_07159 [Puccinia graminis f. sp. tritici CRL 75-36-700-3]|uniref:Uncharacterized protein n=1 Tax=Puccinia graminis f. sp. tritici (strain CRL 75-36-700-3 / race SCCL) TaxID=418459 RepID=E3K9K8_PUCGT|nr:uncharacterized protein PGTG_07159 [Puccinia graminis f. sp. tritici CRL 75-36-700-3]EFP80907.2 hypothetical protein PGTG_07159 [Puccinia graminis f. sp. tritici CRL 75-36-700-3]
MARNAHGRNRHNTTADFLITGTSRRSRTQAAQIRNQARELEEHRAFLEEVSIAQQLGIVDASYAQQLAGPPHEDDEQERSQFEPLIGSYVGEDFENDPSGGTPPQNMIKFVSSLPPSTNPYVALAGKIRDQTRIAKPVLWGIIVRRIITFQFCVLCAQAITVLWLRKKANKLRFFRCNKLGLIHVEVLNEIVLLMLVFSVLAVIDLVTQEFVEQGSMVFSNKLILRTCKFPIAADVCWCMSSSQLDLPLPSKRVSLMKPVSGMNPIDFRSVSVDLRDRECDVILLFKSTGTRRSIHQTSGVHPFQRQWLTPRRSHRSWGEALLLGTSIQGTLSIRGIEQAAREIIETLLRAAPSYRPETFNYLSMFGLILEPGQRILSGTKRFAHEVRLIQILYIVQHLLIATLYMPTSIFALRGLRNQVTPECALKRGPAEEEESLPNYQLQIMTLTMKTPGQEMANQEKVRKRLIKQTLMLYLDTILYCPPLMYMLSYKGVSFFNDPTWVLIEQLGTHGHTAIIGNIILALLIKNAIYTNKRAATSTLAPPDIPYLMRLSGD